MEVGVSLAYLQDIKLQHARFARLKTQLVVWVGGGRVCAVDLVFQTLLVKFCKR